MTTLFFIFVILVIAHFIIEEIIAPTERSKVRLDLFALRDEIRGAKIECGNEFDNELYDHLQDHANRGIYLLHNYGLVGVIRFFVEDIKETPLRDQVTERVNRFLSLLHESRVPGLQRIHIKNLMLTAKGFAYNSLGWLPIVIVPSLLIVTAFYIGRVTKKVKNACGWFIALILEMPESALNDHFPQNQSRTSRLA